MDSMAHAFRDVGDKPGLAELAGRTELLFRISSMLRCAGHRAGLGWAEEQCALGERASWAEGGQQKKKLSKAAFAQLVHKILQLLYAMPGSLAFCFCLGQL